MTRRSSRPQWLSDDADIPPGWTRHDGSCCPINLDTKPALLFRSSTKIRAGLYTAKHWRDFSTDCWAWKGRKPDGFDIIAYQLIEE